MRRIKKEKFDLDVPKENVLSLRKNVLIVEFSREALNKFIGRYRNIFLPLSIILVVVVASSIALRSRADVASLYSSKCLGSWENSHNAEGKPEVTKGDIENGDGFSVKNSALLNNSNAQIFCGGFNGSIPEDGNPEKIVVKFSWFVTDELLEEKNEKDEILDTENHDPVILDRQDSSGGVNNVGEEIEVEESTESGGNENVVEPEDSSGEEVSPDSPQQEESVSPDDGGGEPVTFFYRIFPRVFAQEAEETTSSDSTTGEVVEDSPAEEQTVPSDDEPSSGNSLEGSSQEEENTSVETGGSSGSGDSGEGASSEDKDDEDEKEEIKVVEKSPDDMLEVLYTLDGTEWKVLGYVDVTNWREASFEISDPAVVFWQDLSSLQISLRTIQKIDEMPIIYLDSIYIEVEYLSNKNIDPNPQPDLLADKLIYDQTFGDIRIIKIVRNEKAQIWYTQIPTVENLASEDFMVIDIDDMYNPEEENTENNEDVGGDLPQPSEVEPISEEPSEESEGNSLINEKVKENFSDDSKDLSVKDSVVKEDAKEEVLEDGGILPKDVDAESLKDKSKTKINPALVWNLVASRGMVSMENIIDYKDGNIFFVNEKNDSLFVFSTNNQSMSSNTFGSDGSSGSMKYIDYKNETGESMRASLNSLGVFEFAPQENSLPF